MRCRIIQYGHDSSGYWALKITPNLSLKADDLKALCFLQNTLCVHDVRIWVYTWQRDKVASVLNWVWPLTETTDQSSQHLTTGHWRTLRGRACVFVRGAVCTPKCLQPSLLPSEQVPKPVFKFEWNAVLITPKSQLFPLSSSVPGLLQVQYLVLIIDPGGFAGTRCPIMVHPECGEMLSAPPSSPWFSLFSVSFRVKNNGRIVSETQATLNALCVCLCVSQCRIIK